jgi:small ligand-binding sensory domain FIST
LFEGGKTYRSGLVGVALSGDISVDTIVAQGCRPVGEPMMVTKSEGSIVQRLGDATPMEILKELFNGADKHDKWLIRRGLHVGIVVDRFTTSFSGGDFLIRNVIGLDQVTGGIKVSDVAQEGQIVQFHLRDAATARADLAAALQQYVDVRLGQRPEAALLFSNIGRGHHLYREADHDTNLFREIIAPVPLTGLFCNGEIGPIGESTFLHGYTSSFALISRRGPRRGSSTPGD